MIKKRATQKITLLLLSCMLFAVVFGNPGTVLAATEVLTSYSQTVLSADEVGDDIYLQNVLTLNDNESFVGIFASPSNYQYYYGTSTDLLNWNLTSQYFSLVHGNGIFVGISGKFHSNELKLTKDGQVWTTAELPEGINPLAVKFENGYFKLTSRDDQGQMHLYISKDAETWYDLHGDLPEGAKLANVLIAGGKFYSLVGTSISGDGFRVYSASTVNSSATAWEEVTSLGRDGFGLDGNIFFNGKTVGVQLYSIADYEKEGYVSDKLYYVTDDFINWEEKDWTQERSGYYSVYDSTSTDNKNVSPDSQRFEAVEVLPYLGENDDWPFLASTVVHSVDGVEWLNESINIYVGDTKVSKDPLEQSALSGLDKLAWARKGAEYVIGRDYLSQYYLTPYEENITRQNYLTLIMRALNVQAPDKPREGYVPFEDVWYAPMVERANQLGLVNGVGQNQFAPNEYISRQDMMVMTYNILDKLGKIEADTELTALSGYNDKDKVREYAKLAVSSLSKADIITGSGNNVNPTDSVTNAEAVVIAERLNKYRFR